MIKGLLILLLFGIAFSFVYWIYDNRVETGEVFVKKDDNTIFVYVKNITKELVYFECDKQVFSLPKSEFKKQYRKIHFYV